MHAATSDLTLSGCLAEIASHDIPWAGDPGASFHTGLYAVLDHIDDGASALLYFRPQDQQFLLYVYVPAHDERVASGVADAVTRYLRHAEVIYGEATLGEPLPGAVVYELDEPEARRRMDALRRVLTQPVCTGEAHCFH